MNAALNLLMQYLTKIVAPSSTAYGNMPFIKGQSLSEVISQLREGDIIFTKTNNSVYQLARKLVNVEYDHVAVIINSTEVIHISPPTISKLPIEILVQKDREPLIFRPKLERKEEFLTILTSFLGEKYNIEAISSLFWNKIKQAASYLQERHEFSIQTLKYSRICTEAILYTLCKADDQINEYTSSYISTDQAYQNLGHILTSHLIKILQNHGNIVYKSPPTPSKTVVDYVEIVSERLNQQIQNKIKPLKKPIQNVDKIWKLKDRMPMLPFLVQKRKELQGYFFIMNLLMTIGEYILKKYDIKVEKNLKPFILILSMWMMISYVLPVEYKISPSMIAKL